MSFTKDKGIEKSGKYKYRTRKERVTLHIVDGTESKENSIAVPVLDPSFMTDPLGSYTGTPLDRNDLPVQDADDL